MLCTENCVKCGKPAVMFTGHVVGLNKGAIGVPYVQAVIAGWCSDECHDSTKSSDNGCFGKYNPEIMGKCKPFGINK